MTQATPEIYAFGEFRLNADRRLLLTTGGETVSIMPKAFDTLLLLVRNAGRTVSKDEILTVVWHGRVVEENNLTQSVSAVRKLLGERPDQHRFIATVPGRGYRFVAEVRQAIAAEENGRARRLRPTSVWAAGLVATGLVAALVFSGRDIFDGSGGETALPPVAEQPSIAVLPFANMSSDPGQEYFSDGLSEELLTQLARLPGLRVIGRTSSFAFKGKTEDLRTIGHMLGVNHVLEGSVRKEGNRVRVTAQLIDSADGSHLWSETYDRELGDIFTIQDEIAKTVASALRSSIAARIVEQGGTRSFTAYDAFLAGRASALEGGPNNLLAGIAAFERAVAIDPGFTAAWGWLADAYQQASIDVPDRRAEWLEKMLRAENRLLELGPGWLSVNLRSAEREMSNGNLIEAESLFESVKNLPPSGGARYVPYGLFLLKVGRPKEAIDLLLHDRQTEPLMLAPALWLQIAYDMVGDDARAEAEYRRALGFVDDTRAIRGMALVRAMGRRDREAMDEELPTVIAIGPLARPVHEAMQRLLDDPPAARAELRRLLDDPATLNNGIMVMLISSWAAYFGDAELALQALRKLPPLAAGNDLRWAIWRPLARDMRRLPGFKELVHDWGLVDYWRATGKWGDFCRPKGADDFECE